MIASIQGRLSQKDREGLIVDVGSSESHIGYLVHVSDQTFRKLPALETVVSLHIVTIVREDDFILFGFLDLLEKKLFQKLLSVNGVGPKLALTILSGLPPTTLMNALQKEDLATLTSISGIGKKTAERMVLDLRDKLKDLTGDGSEPHVSGFKSASLPSTKLPPLLDEVLSALLHLGYTRTTAEKAVMSLPYTEVHGTMGTMDTTETVETLIRKALRWLSESKL